MSFFSGKPSSGGGASSSSFKKNQGISGGGFQSLGLSEPVYRGIVKMGFRIPTPVQRKSLPVVLSGSDTVVMARTGSGKTAAFLIPVLERLLASRGGGDESGGGGGDRNRSAGAVILSPTRELSIQSLRVCRTLSSLTNLKSIGINGGESMEKQFSLLSSRPDIIVATPGRLAHHLSEIPDFHLKQCEVVVFDEADRLFEMGFAMQIRQICSRMPGPESGRQTLLFSATMPKVLVEFTKSGIMGEPEVVRLDSEVSVSAELRCGFITVRSGEKDAALLHLLRDVLPSAPTVGAQREHGVDDDDDDDDDDDAKNSAGKNKKKRGVMSNRLGLTLIFAATRHHVDYLTTLLNTAGLGMEATGIYGTMDQVARKENLARFRSGEKPILVVTDVAARGIDVPLIDHVIHYAFPPSAKLFVHRSGRAARAGRIGYCWGVVDPEELPYMVDLHVFLGRKLSNGSAEKDDRGEGEHAGEESNGNGEEEKEDNEMDCLTYSLAEMTPDMVHYGCIPELTLVEEVENVRRIADSEMTGSHDTEALKALTRVCNNAMKQYRRSRPEASKAGVRRAKALLEGAKDASGKRIGGGIKPHPLLKLIETKKLLRSTATGEKSGSGKSSEDQVREKLNELKKRDDFLRAMNNFRPKETIFEAFATGKEKAGGVHSQVDRGRTDLLGKRADNKQAAFGAMKSMRRQMKMARDKGSALVVAGSRNALALNGEEAGEDTMVSSAGNAIEVGVDEMAVKAGTLTKKTISASSAPAIPETKRRLSKAERKRLKKKPGAAADAVAANASADTTKKSKNKRGIDFRDAEHYIDNEVTLDPDAVERSRQIEAALQPSASGDTKGLAASALKLEQSMLDIVGDEREDLVKRQRMMRWDKSKRKYVQTSVGDALSGDSRSKKIRLESGQLVESKKIKLGELYEKWQKKTNKSVGRVGVFDDVTADDDGPGTTLGKSGKGTDANYDDGMGKKKTAAQIRKEREAKDNMKRKNMKKEDRRRLERRERTDKTRLQDEHMSKAAIKAANRGKKGPSGRWANKTKKRR